MKSIVFISAMVLFLSNQVTTKSVLSIDSIKSSMDSIKNTDSITSVFNLDSFLLQPFDLYKFKSKKNGSLSGGANLKKYHFKPAFKGIAYRFFMFEPKTVNYIVDGKEMKHCKVGYVGLNKNRISFREDGLIIKTYQPNDKFKNKYINPNEVLIELTAKYNDFDLPELAFVGLDSIAIVKQLGKEMFYKNSSLIYTKDNVAFILKLKQSKAEWIRYVLLADILELEIENSELFNADN
ncbi:MAG: hypothetical protein R2852_06880 [Bacteroidia bacterium]